MKTIFIVAADALFIAFVFTVAAWFIGVFFDGLWPLSQGAKNVVVFSSLILAIGLQIARDKHG